MRLVAAEDTVDYQPEYDGNRDEREPAVFKLKPLNAGELRKHQLVLARVVERKRMNDAREEIEGVLLQGIRSIAGITLRRVTAEGKMVDAPLESVTEFLDHAPEALKMELYGALTNPSKLDDGLGALEGLEGK